jgi:D-alanine-D-alanine ligase
MTFQVKRPLRVAVLMHEACSPPAEATDEELKQLPRWKTEYDVVSALRRMGHEVFPIGHNDELGGIRRALDEHRPQVTFNLIEEFLGNALFDQHVVSFLELMKEKYTGCNPRGLTLARDKGLSKKILAYHRIPVPGFAVFPMNRKVRRPRRLTFPLLVKSVSEEGSAGIARASVVNDDEKLRERVEFIHRHTNTHAIVEQYIGGREIYVGVIGNQLLQTYAPWELSISKLPDGAPNIATGRMKWDAKYQEKVGLSTGAADLAPELQKKLERLSKRIYRTLFLSGYARLDYRLTDDGQFYLLEANPNPNIAHGDDFADSAAHSGVPYEALLQKIITLGLSYQSAP